MKKTIMIVIVSFFALTFSGACSRDVPKPELKVKQVQEIIPATAVHKMRNEEDPFFIHHHVDGADVYVQCILKGITFRKDGTGDTRQGKLIVYVNGKKVQEVQAATFIVKQLSEGTHHITVEVVDEHNNEYNLKREFSVKI